MKIETKYNVGDEVWIRTLKFNKKVNVIGITINIRTNGELLAPYVEKVAEKMGRNILIFENK